MSPKDQILRIAEQTKFKTVLADPPWQVSKQNWQNGPQNISACHDIRHHEAG